MPRRLAYMPGYHRHTAGAFAASRPRTRAAAGVTVDKTANTHGD